jgi:endonuclease III-like uncharacterized protein
MLRDISVGLDAKGVKNENLQSMLIWVLKDREFIHDLKTINFIVKYWVVNFLLGFERDKSRYFCHKVEEVGLLFILQY